MNILVSVHFIYLSFIYFVISSLWSLKASPFGTYYSFRDIPDWLARGGQGQQDKPVGSEEVNNPQNPRAKSR